MFRRGCTSPTCSTNGASMPSGSAPATPGVKHAAGARGTTAIDAGSTPYPAAISFRENAESVMMRSAARALAR